jgi:signal transduction histidine kinase
VELRVERGWLWLRVADDGRGFDPAAESEGHGLPSMRRRALSLGGTLEVTPRPGGGTEVRLKIRN